MPHTIAGQSASMLLMNREIQSRLDLIKPVLKSIETGNQYSYLESNKFEIGMTVASRNYLGDKWKFGRVISIIRNLHYIIKLDEGMTIKRHCDQIRKIGENVPLDNLQKPDIIAAPLRFSLPENKMLPTLSNQESNISVQEIPTFPVSDFLPIALRKSPRVVKPPVKLDL
jgi:hypothetical protein